MSDELQKKLDKAALDLKKANSTVSDKNAMLEVLDKELRKKNHDASQKKAEYEANIESYKRKVDSLEELNKSLKLAQEDPKSMQLEERVHELEKLLHISEQNEMNLKRQLQERTMELGDLKLSYEKQRLEHEMAEKIQISQTTSKTNSQGLDNLDDETTELLNGLLAEVEELKKEKNNVHDKAVTRLTEKEVEILHMRQEMDQMANSYRAEINELLLKLSEVESAEAEDNISEKSKNAIDDEENPQIALELKLEIESLKQELMSEQEKNKHYESNNESEAANQINQLKSEVYNLKIELEKAEMDKMEYQKTLELNSKANSSIYLTIEEYDVKCRVLEELKDKMETNLKEQIMQVNHEASKYEELHKSALIQNESLVGKLKQANNDKKDLMNEKYKLTGDIVTLKDSLTKSFNEKSDLLNKEILMLKTEIDRLAKVNDKLKKSAFEAFETIRSQKEDHGKVIIELEEKIADLENKLEGERQFGSNSGLVKRKGKQTKRQIHTRDLDSLENMMAETEETTEVDIEIENQTLKVQNLQLSQTIVDFNIKITNANKDYEHLCSVHSKLKEDNKEMKSLYESQIKSLQNKSLAEVTRSSVKLRGSGDQLKVKNSQLFMDINKEVSTLKAEKKYLEESLSIMLNEKESLAKIQLNEIEYLKEEIKAAEQLAIASKIEHANHVIEADDEINRLANLNRRYKDRLITLGSMTGIKTI